MDDEQNLRIICREYPEETIKIKGIGVIRQEEGCIGVTDEVTIISEETNTDQDLRIQPKDRPKDFRRLHNIRGT